MVSKTVDLILYVLLYRDQLDLRVFLDLLVMRVREELVVSLVVLDL